jgi:hypothetical protein
MGDIDQRENYFLEEIYVSSHHSIPHLFPCDEKETSCVENLSSYFSAANQEEIVSTDNETFWIITNGYVRFSLSYLVFYITINSERYGTKLEC